MTRYTEAEFAQLVKQRDTDPIERVRGGVKGKSSWQSGHSRASISSLAKTKVQHVRPSPYKSKWEANYASLLELEKRAGVIKDYTYEMHTFKLAYRQYHRSDFLIWHVDGSIEFAQVKGHHPNMRASIKGLKWAARINPWFIWTIKRLVGQGWESKRVVV